jgi:hypothetical protein
MKEVDGSPSKFAVDLRSMLAKVAREFQFSTPFYAAVRRDCIWAGTNTLWNS